jgi:hypothetical protein
MVTVTGSIHIAVSVALQDAGEATRAVELACGLRDARPGDVDLHITFLTHGSRFEPMVRAAGFDLLPCAPQFEGRSMNHDLGWDPPQFVGSVEIARDLILGERDALAALSPDVVMHGFWPFANIASRMLGIPVMSFLPLPLHPVSATRGLINDLPDQVPGLSRLPAPVRRAIVRAIPGPVKGRLGASAQTRISEAIMECGWQGAQPRTIFSMLQAGLTVVNDLPDFYPDWPVADNLAITGPLFASQHDTEELDPQIRAVFDPNDPAPKVFCTMGSSGSKETLLAAIRAIAGQTDAPWNAVVLASPAVCSLGEARACVVERPSIVVTDTFVPAAAVNALADVVVSHGGQGTVQTALASGSPIVGVAMQAEQQINLDHVVIAGAGIRIPLRRWNEPTIRTAVHAVLTRPGYRRQAQHLAQVIGTYDGRRAAADRMWRYLATVLPR